MGSDRRAARARLVRVAVVVVLVGLSLFVDPPALHATEIEMVTRTERVTLSPRPRPAGGPAEAATASRGAATADGWPFAAGRGITRTSDEFVLIGITVDEVPTSPVRVRARSTRGDWSPWFDVSFPPAEATEGSDPNAHVSEPLWTGPSDAYELDAPASLATAQVHLVGEKRVTVTNAPQPATAGAATPGIIPRSSWGARPPTQDPGTADVLKLGIVHHSAGGNTYSAAQVPAVLRSMQAYHQDANGWYDIAYNFAVDRFGRTWEARWGGVDKLVIGGHSRGFNTSSVGVVVLGEFSATSVPSSVTEAVSNLLSWKFSLHNAYPGGTVAYTTKTGSAKYPAGTTVTLPRVVGHRDVQATSCPGARLYALLPTIRSRVAQLWPGHRARTVGTDTVGVQVEPGAALSNSPHGEDWEVVPFGQPGDTVLAGDWNNDGVDTLGVRRGRYVLLTNDPDGGEPTTTFAYGLDTDVPLVGDWNGDGLDTIGIRRGATFYLRDSNTSGPATRTFAYGRASDVPIVADWDGNVTDTPAVRRGNTFYVRNSNTGGTANYTFAYGIPSDVPMAGDWDANGIDSPGVQRGNVYYLRNKSSGGPADSSFVFLSPDWRPLTGDWDQR